MELISIGVPVARCTCCYRVSISNWGLWLSCSSQMMNRTGHTFAYRTQLGLFSNSIESSSSDLTLSLLPFLLNVPLTAPSPDPRVRLRWTTIGLRDLCVMANAKTPVSKSARVLTSTGIRPHMPQPTTSWNCQPRKRTMPATSPSRGPYICYRSLPWLVRTRSISKWQELGGFRARWPDIVRVAKSWP